MKLLDGKSVSESILDRLSLEIRGLGFQPGLGVILVGNDPASHLYVRLKELAAERIGVRIEKKVFLEQTSKEDIEEAIRMFNRDGRIHGILVQLPLPRHLPVDDIIGVLDPAKDADGFHQENEERLARGEGGLMPVFPRAILELARSSGVRMWGKRAVVVGNSARFGTVMCRLLEQEGVSAQYLPSEACAGREGLEIVKKAGIVISACGKEGIISGGMLSPGAIVIDGGIVKGEHGVIGDVDRRSVEELDGWLSPVPGGVGPVTIACLLSNVVQAAKWQKEE